MSPTKTGEMREDRFWLLKSVSSEAFYCEEGGFFIEPITTQRINCELYQSLPRLAPLMLEGNTYHGRRVNDEVELFEWNDGKETPGLRKALLEKGLTVRTYKPEGKPKFPKPSKSSSTSLPDLEPVEQCCCILRAGIAEEEETTQNSIKHAVLAAAKKNGRNAILVFHFRAKEFFEFLGQENNQTYIKDGIAYDVLAFKERGDINVRCSNEDFMSFFGFNKSGERVVQLVHYDESSNQEVREREAAKMERKRAKKHRRQGTTSTSSSPSEMSLALQMPLDKTAVKARQREKNKEKKKAQKERRKQAEEIQWRDVITANLASRVTILQLRTSSEEEPSDKQEKKASRRVRSEGSDNEGCGTQYIEDGRGGNSDGSSRKKRGPILIAYPKKTESNVSTDEDQTRKGFKFLGRGL